MDPAGIAQSVGIWALGREVLGSNLQAVLEVTLGHHSLTIPKCKTGTRPRPGNSRVYSKDHYMQVRAE